MNTTVRYVLRYLLARSLWRALRPSRRGPLVSNPEARIIERGFEFYRDGKGAYWRREVVKSDHGWGDIQTTRGNWHPYVDAAHPPTIRPRTGLTSGPAGEPTEDNYDTYTRRVGWGMIVFGLALGVWLVLAALHWHP